MVPSLVLCLGEEDHRGKAPFSSHHPKGGLPGSASSKETACQCRRYKRCGFDLWVGKIPWRRAWFDPWVKNIPWRRAWQPIPVFLPGDSPWTEEPGGQQSRVSQSWT